MAMKSDQTSSTLITGILLIISTNCEDTSLLVLGVLSVQQVKWKQPSEETTGVPFESSAHSSQISSCCQHSNSNLSAQTKCPIYPHVVATLLSLSLSHTHTHTHTHTLAPSLCACPTCVCACVYACVSLCVCIDHGPLLRCALRLWTWAEVSKNIKAAGREREREREREKTREGGRQGYRQTARERERARERARENEREQERERERRLCPPPALHRTWCVWTDAVHPPVCARWSGY